MLNKVNLMGRLTADVELRSTNSGTNVASFTLAVQKNFKSADGTYGVDFIDCVAWRNTADFISKYFSKGNLMAVSGELQTRMWEDKNGSKHKATEIVVDGAYFCESKGSAGNFNNNSQGQNSNQSVPNFNNFDQSDDFEEMTDDDELPF